MDGHEDVVEIIRLIDCVKNLPGIRVSMRSALAGVLLMFSLCAIGANDRYDMMMQAIRTNDIARARVLLTQKLDPNARKDTRASPTFLTLAAGEGRVEMIELLLKAGAAINTPDGDMLTPLMQASWHGHLQAVKLLVKYGASLGESSKWGETALELAEKAGHAEVARALKEAGAR
jgi:ankyrin repeat protein